MRIQTLFEEKLNSITHAIGVLLGIAALVLLIVYNTNKTNWSLFSVIVYGISIIVLFSASTIFHATKKEKQKHYFRIVDHISIYLLIAGTYTPVWMAHVLGCVGHCSFRGGFKAVFYWKV
jgi:hemolysin III